MSERTYVVVNERYSRVALRVKLSELQRLCANAGMSVELSEQEFEGSHAIMDDTGQVVALELFRAGA